MENVLLSLPTSTTKQFLTSVKTVFTGTILYENFYTSPKIETWLQ